MGDFLPAGVITDDVETQVSAVARSEAGEHPANQPADQAHRGRHIGGAHGQRCRVGRGRHQQVAGACNRIPDPVAATRLAVVEPLGNPARRDEPRRPFDPAGIEADRARPLTAEGRVGSSQGWCWRQQNDEGS